MLFTMVSLSCHKISIRSRTYAVLIMVMIAWLQQGVSAVSSLSVWLLGLATTQTLCFLSSTGRIRWGYGLLHNGFALSSEDIIPLNNKMSMLELKV